MGSYFFQSLTPGPSPGAPMNSTPAASKAFLRSINDCERLGGTSSWDSRRRIVLRVTPLISAASTADQFKSARAALICIPVITIKPQL